MKKNYIIKPILVIMILCLFNQVKGQIIITSEPDSIAVLNHPYLYQVNTIFGGSAPEFSLNSKPNGMAIDSATGLITWTPINMADGGKVVVQATNNMGTTYQSFFIYIANEFECNANIVAYWPMDYITDTSVLEVANAYDATLYFSNEDTIVPLPVQSEIAMIGKSILFTPTGFEDKFYLVNEKDPFQFTGDDDFSVSFWFKNHPSEITPFRVEVMVGKYSATGRWQIFWNHVTKKIEFNIREASTHSDTLIHSAVITDNDWHHVVATFNGVTALNNGSILTLYVDQLAVTEEFDYWQDNFLGDGNFSIGYWNTGAHGNSYPYSGYLDEIIYYDKELTAEEVNNLYDKGVAGEAICFPRNFAPLVMSEPVTTATEDLAFSYQLQGRDIDGEPLSFSSPLKPDWLSFNASTGELYGTPDNDHVGIHNIILRVSDGITNVDQTFQVTVANTNDLPIITSLPDDAVQANTNYLYIITATDVDDGDVLTYSAISIPSWLTFTPSATFGSLSGTPSADNQGSHTIILKVNDGQADVTQEYDLVVSAPSAIYDIDNSIVHVVFPNPASDIVYFMLANSGKVRIELYNISGKLQNKINAENDETIELNVSELATGLYIYKVYQNNKLSVGKITKD